MSSPPKSFTNSTFCSRVKSIGTKGNGNVSSSNFFVSEDVFSVLVLETEVIVHERAHEHHSGSIFVAEERERLVGGILQIAEADDVAAVLDAVENAVSAAVCLQQPVHFEVFVHPERVQRLCIESREEHTHDNEYINLTVFHAQREVFVIVLELLAVGGVFCVESLVVFLDGHVVEEIP